MKKHIVFEYLPVESIIKLEQDKYYAALNQSDSLGHSTPFITFMLQSILKALNRLYHSPNISVQEADRSSLFKEATREKLFTRKDYLQYFKTISTATASRDLKWGTETGIINKTGDKRMTRYSYT